MALPLPCHGLRTVADKVDKRSHKPRESFWALKLQETEGERESLWKFASSPSLPTRHVTGPEKAKKSKRDKGPV